MRRRRRSSPSALASWGLQTYKFSPASVIGFRIAIFTIFAALVGALVRAAARAGASATCRSRCTSKSTSRRCRPRSSAPSIPARSAGRRRRADVPPVILERMIEQAVEKCRRSIQGGSEIGQTGHSSAARSCSARSRPWPRCCSSSVPSSSARARRRCSCFHAAPKPPARTPSRSTPGDATIPKGSDQSITAKLTGFRSSDVALMVQAEGEADVPAHAARLVRRRHVVRRHAVRRQEADRLLRRGRRRASRRPTR